MQVRLKQLLQLNHWQTYRTFCREYDKAAMKVDAHLRGSWPSRAQLHRWTSGDLKSLPYSDHCLVLEAMFPGWNAEQLFALVEEHQMAQPAGVAPDIGTRLAMTLARRVTSPDLTANWGMAGTSGLASSTASMDRDRGLISIEAGSDEDVQSRAIADKLLILGKVLRMPLVEIEQLAILAGNVIELELSVNIDISANGDAVVNYRHLVLNLTAESLSRFAREIWFEYTSGKVLVQPLDVGDRRVGLHRINSTGTMTKFNCRVSPPLQSGDSALVAYSCTGGRFEDALYWRQVMHRHTRKFTLVVRHEDIKQLTACTVVTEHSNGSETSEDECVVWDYEAGSAIMTATLDHLMPHQAVTLSWEI
jgi:hypothetical protein